MGHEASNFYDQTFPHSLLPVHMELTTTVGAFPTLHRYPCCHLNHSKSYNGAWTYTGPHCECSRWLPKHWNELGIAIYLICIALNQGVCSDSTDFQSNRNTWGKRNRKKGVRYLKLQIKIDKTCYIIIKLKAIFLLTIKRFVNMLNPICLNLKFKLVDVWYSQTFNFIQNF